jgi:hypothetical protein
MEMALIYDRPSFVELLFENKFDLNDFFTAKRLYYLYNAITVFIHIYIYLYFN